MIADSALFISINWLFIYLFIHIHHLLIRNKNEGHSSLASGL
jgi:hypothetical protein